MNYMNHHYLSLSGIMMLLWLVVGGGWLHPCLYRHNILFVILYLYVLNFMIYRKSQWKAVVMVYGMEQGTSPVVLDMDIFIHYLHWHLTKDTLNNLLTVVRYP